jgi:hypothetical protein
MKHLRLAIIMISILGATASTWAGPQDKAASDAGTKTPPASSRKEEGDYVTEKRNDGTTIKYKKKTSYDFEGANIEGLYNKPSGSYISNIKDVKGKSIIRVRENFDAEVIDSSRQLK